MTTVAQSPWRHQGVYTPTVSRIVGDHQPSTDADCVWWQMSCRSYRRPTTHRRQSRHSLSSCSCCSVSAAAVSTAITPSHAHRPPMNVQRHSATAYVGDTLQRRPVAPAARSSRWREPLASYQSTGQAESDLAGERCGTRRRRRLGTKLRQSCRQHEAAPSRTNSAGSRWRPVCRSVACHRRPVVTSFDVRRLPVYRERLIFNGKLKRCCRIKRQRFARELVGDLTYWEIGYADSPPPLVYLLSVIVRALTCHLPILLFESGWCRRRTKVIKRSIFSTH